MLQGQNEQTWIDVPNLVGGWNLLDSASSIKDNESPSVTNVVFDGGLLSPRSGSVLLWSKPTAETQAPLQNFTVKTSDGVNYYVAVYGNNFYLREEGGSVWIKLNQTYTPVETTLYYGNVNWNNGRGNDTFYFGNGVDATMKWQPCTSLINGTLTGAETSLVIDDGTRFPTPVGYVISGVNQGTETLTVASNSIQTGDVVFYDSTSTVITGLTDGGIYFAIRVSATDMRLATTYANAIAGTAIDFTGAGAGTQTIFKGETILLIQDGATTTIVPYISKSVNTLTLTKAIGVAIADNASVTLMLIPKNVIPKGKILAKHQLRLFSSNYYGGETNIWYSVQGNAEDFTVGSTVAAAATTVISDGNGEVTGLHDFGEFLVIEKQDSLHRFNIKVSADLGSKLDEIIPLVSGQSLGPIRQATTVKVLNSLMYLTNTEGFISLYPQSSGGQSGVKYEIVSSKIQSYITDQASFDKCRGVVFDQKVLFAHATVGGSQNTKILVYDTLRQIWSLISGWAIADFTVKDNELLFLENGTGNVYQAFTSSYHDNGSAYVSEFYTKQFNFGAFSRPKTGGPIYIQGFMTPATDLFVDVLYNEGGELKTQTFNIDKDTARLYYSSPLSAALGQPIMGLPILSSTVLAEIGDVSFFRCYLGVSVRHGFYVIQLRIYSNKQAFWAVSGIGFNPSLSPVIPGENIIDPIIIS